jgi:hypothetical protein
MPKPDQTSFELLTSDVERQSDKLVLRIKGIRSGRPNRRFILKPGDVKILSAKINRYQKNKQFEYSISRLNRLPTKQQVRIHSDSLLYPGEYTIELELALDSKLPDQII